MPNGWRYPLVISTGSIRRGGTRQRHFAGTNLKPRKLLENAATPTITTPAHFAGVHAVLGALTEGKMRNPQQNTTAYLTKFYRFSNNQERLNCLSIQKPIRPATARYMNVNAPKNTETVTASLQTKR
jgi:hypothetical protein